MTLYKKLKTNDSLTDNGAVTHSTSDNACLDLFFLVGACRNKDINSTMQLAYYENKDLCTRIMLWARDIRQGAGEREQFRNYMRFLYVINDIETLKAITLRIPELGRWDDVFSLSTLPDFIIDLIKEGIANKDALLAKWMPREKSSKKALAVKLRTALNMSPMAYRKMLATLTNVVETNLCNKDYSFNYEHVPSKAMLKYTKAFYRNDNERFGLYKTALSQGIAKINSSAVYPHEVLFKAYMESEDVAKPMWKALPNWLKSENAILPIVDVSSSMGEISHSNLDTPIWVSLAIGIYIAQRNIGNFKGLLMTFCGHPEICTIPTLQDKFSLKEIVDHIYKHAPDMNTDIQAVFELLLKNLKDGTLTVENMPKTLLIISDMEFDSTYCEDTNFDTIEKKYKKAGFSRPNLIFWNVDGREGNIPVKIHNTGTTLISGRSPSIIKSVLGCEIDPEIIMMKVIMSERYNY